MNQIIKFNVILNRFEEVLAPSFGVVVTRSCDWICCFYLFSCVGFFQMTRKRTQPVVPVRDVPVVTSDTEKSFFHIISEILDTAMGVKSTADLQWFVHLFVGLLFLLTIALMFLVPESRMLLGGFLALLVGLVASIAWVVSEVTHAN